MSLVSIEKLLMLKKQIKFLKLTFTEIHKIGKIYSDRIQD